MSEVMRIYGTADDMRSARHSLGAPAALAEALVATGIDAFFWLLDGGAVEVEGTVYRLAREEQNHE